jgi:tetratricopeptide (TPR) repeat protein
VLLVSGEPGVGKSRLVRELVTQVQVGREVALVGECYAEGGAPYAPFGQMVRQALDLDGATERLALPDFALADLVALAPALRFRFLGVPPNPRLDPELEQQRLFESVVALCSALGARGPLLIVLEDGHWADSGSLALLRHLARRTRRLPVLMVVTYREVELDETRPFRDLLVDLNRERLATRLKLSRLDREGTRRLLAALFATEITPEFRDGIYRETEGNPFFVEEVCKALVESGSLTFADGDWHRPTMDQLDVPQSVRLAIQARMGRLPDRVRQVLHMAAILGRQFSVDVVVEAMGRAGVDEEAVIEALETAARAQLIEEVGGGRELFFAFVHALTATTLAEGVPTLRRRRLHRQAAEAVERLHPEDDEALAHHYAAAGDEEHTLTYSIRAGDRAAAAYANVEAERHYRAALELSKTGAGRAELLGKLGVALARQSRYEEALASWRLGIELFVAAGDWDGVACLCAYAGRALWERGDRAGGLAMCREGMAAVGRMAPEPAATVGMARLLHETARACILNLLPEEGVPLGRQALDLAERLGAVELQAEALITLAVAPGQTPQEEMALLKRAIELAEAAGLLPQAARAEGNLGSAYLLRILDLGSARAHFLRAAELYRQTGSVVMELLARLDAAMVTLVQGMLVDAEQELLALRQLAAAVPDPGLAALSLSGLEVQLLRYQGQLTEAAAEWQVLRAEAAAAGDLWYLHFFAARLADVYFEMGNEREAEAAAGEAMRANEQLPLLDLDSTCDLIVWRAKRGELETARSLLSRVRQQITASGEVTPFDANSLTFTEPFLAAAEGRWPEALAAFERATAECRRFGVRWWLGRMLCEWAEALLARGEPGDREPALSLLGQAAAEFEAIGAPYYAEQAKRRMAGLEQT